MAARVLDAIVMRFNDWLGSYAGFVQAVAVSLAWNVGVILGLDKHGFLYLYIATELGIITQFNLAIIGRRSGAKVDAALAEIDNAGDERRTVLEVAVKSLENQEHVLEAVAQGSETIVEISRRDIELGEKLETMLVALQTAVGQMQTVVTETRNLHERNTRMIDQLVDRNRSILTAALEAATIEPPKKEPS